MKMSNPPLVMIYADAKPVVRVGKIAKTLTHMGYQINFWGWDRHRRYPDRFVQDGMDHRMILHGGGESNKSLAFMYPLWALKVFLHLLRKRPSLVYAANLDTAFPCALASFLYPLKFIYDNHDTYYMRYLVPSPIIWILKMVERFTLRRSNWVFLPDENRMTRIERPYAPKTTVIYNCPEDVPPTATGTDQRPFTVFLSGYLREDRGTRLLLQAARQMGELRILAAGNIPDPNLEQEIRAHRQVDFRGYLPLWEALALCHQVDLIFTFYDPKRELNRYAASNKWYDAMMAGKPILVNSEVLNAQWIAQEDIGYLCPYGDVQALINCLRHISQHKEEALRKGQKGRRLFETKYDWPNMEKRLRNVFSAVFGTGDRT